MRNYDENLKKEFRPANEIRYNKHRNRKNNDLVAAMYAMYCCGPEGRPYTLEEVGKIYRRSRQAVYDVFKSRGYPLRSKPVKESVIIDGRKFTPRHDRYWRATAGDRKQLHVYIWEREFGKLPAGHGIHHKDLDRGNNDLANLECLPIAVISSQHNPHLNQFTSPTGSRKWKRGRIIPIKNEAESQNNLRKPEESRGAIHRGAILRGVSPDTGRGSMGSSHRIDNRQGNRGIDSPPGREIARGQAARSAPHGMPGMPRANKGQNVAGNPKAFPNRSSTIPRRRSRLA